MAKVAVNVKISQGAPYTVPAGKYLIANFYYGGGSTSGGSPTVNVNGVPIIWNMYESENRTGAICANAGDVISVTSTGDVAVVAFSGFLFDV